ncbi:hypothetical protein CEXT_120701 [Caerostris extrusa]|uniref:Uncharacterized protein n=1 Tax=Caerostris extrusa TaxID=172846 RepID=A0AAV4X0X9_CAEEX|nr:hypothetical protein CEXT_120701 [Caerostris extrusa]
MHAFRREKEIERGVVVVSLYIYIHPSKSSRVGCSSKKKSSNSKRWWSRAWLKCYNILLRELFWVKGETAKGSSIAGPSNSFEYSRGPLRPPFEGHSLPFAMPLHARREGLFFGAV